MAKALNILRKLGLFQSRDIETQSAFDQRLQQMGGVRHVSVARAVLFRTGLSH
jgi:hypothetical protein